MEFKKHKLTNVTGSYKENGTVTNITGDIITSAISVDTTNNTITMIEIGSVYSFKVYGQTDVTDHSYSSITFSQNGVENSSFGVDAKVYSTTGWYGGYNLVVDRTTHGGGITSVNASTAELPVPNGTTIYFTPVFSRDSNGNVYFGILWCNTPYFEKDEYYMKLCYGGGTTSYNYNTAVYSFFNQFDAVEVVSTTDTSRFNLKSWLFGFVLGLTGRPLPVLTKATSIEEVSD